MYAMFADARKKCIISRWWWWGDFDDDKNELHREGEIWILWMWLLWLCNWWKTFICKLSKYMNLLGSACIHVQTEEFWKFNISWANSSLQIFMSFNSILIVSLIWFTIYYFYYTAAAWIKIIIPCVYICIKKQEAAALSLFKKWNWI